MSILVGLLVWMPGSAISVPGVDSAMAVLDAAEAPPAQQGEAATHTARLLANSTLDYARAAEHLRAALRHYRAAGDEAAAAKVHSRLGTLLCTHHRVMDIPAALEHFAAAEPVRTGDTAALHLQAGTARAALHGLRIAQGSTAAARAVELADTLERPDLMVWASWGRAWHRFNLGELAAARTSLEEAWAIAQELDRPYSGWAPVYAAATQYNVYLQDPAASEAWCQQGLSQPRLNTIAHPRDGILDHLVYALATMGRREAAHEAVAGLPADAVSRRLLLQQQGEWESAERSWAEALDHDLAAGDLLDAVLNLYWLGQVRWLLGREANATASLRRALAISLDGPQVPAELMVRAELARLLALGGAAVEAAEHVRRCDRILAGGEDWRGQAGNVELARAAVADATQRREQAERAYHRAVEIYVSYRLPWRQAEALRMWADGLSGAGRTGQAKEKRRAAGQVYDQLGVAGRWRGTSPVG